MATLAIGDIHGNSEALDDLLQQVTSEVRRGDVVVFLGDYIDRGNDTKGCVDRILAFREQLAADVVCLCGNHEDWLLRTRRDFCQHTWLLATDPFRTINSYSREAADTLREARFRARAGLYGSDCALPYDVFFDAMPEAHLQFFENLRAVYQTPDCICAHGGVDTGAAGVEGQSRHDFIWGGSGFPERYTGETTVVYGHRNNAVLNRDGWPEPAFTDRTIGIDTIAHGVLTAVRLPDRRVFQTARYAPRAAL